jgi:hypothetical protein
MPQVVVGAALSTGLGYAFGTVTAATLASTFAQNLILGAISYALQDKPKMSEQGLNIGNVREPVSPRKVIYGETRVGGTYLFVDTSEVVWAKLATDPSQLPTDHPHYGDGSFNITDDPITYSSGITINADTYYLATDADGNQCYTGNTTKTYGRIGYLRTKRHNEFFQFVTAVAGHEVEEISDIYFEDEHIATFNQTNNVAETLESGVTRFNSDDGRQTPLFEYREGTSTQTAFRSMLDNIPFDHTTYKTTGVVFDGPTSAGWTQNNAWADCGRNLKYVDGGTQPKDFTDYESVGQAWSSDHQCKDTAVVYGRLAYNPNVYINGLPKVTYRVKGKKLYDPRTSSTAYGNNAALCILDYLMDDKYGLGVSTSEINMASFVEAANVCDEDVTLAEGGTEKRYTINGMIDTSLTPRDVLENMLTACAGKLIYVNGQFTLLAAEYRSPSASITEDDIISSISVATKNSNRSNYNGVKGQFRDPNSEPPFIATEYPVVTSAAFETIDGKQSYTNLDLPFTTSSPTAQRLAKLLLNRSRQEVTISFKAKLSAINVTAGDTISVTNNRLNFTNKTFEVTSSELGFDGTSMYVAITAVEVSSATFDWDAEESAIINNTWTEYRQFEVPTPTDLNVVTTVIVQTDGTAVGGFTITWNASLSENVTSYEVQWKVSSDTDYQSTFTGETSLVGNGTFITGATYNIRVRALTRNGGYSDWETTTVDMPDDAIAPSAPTGLTATGVAEGISLKWTENTERDLKSYVVYENTSNNSGTATPIAILYANAYTRTGLAGGVTRYYWVKAVDFSDNESDFSSVASATSSTITVEADQPRQATGYLYYALSSSSAPSSPTISSYDFDTGTFGSITSNWDTTFTVPDVQGTYWAIRYNVSEDTFEGSQTITKTSVFKWQNMDGLVTFTNLSTDGQTTISGGNITTGSISANRITTGTLDQTSGFGTKIGVSTYVDGLGATWTLGGYFERTANGLGPALFVDDTSSSPSTYAFGSYSQYGGAAVFQRGSGSGTNTVYVNGTDTDGIRVDNSGSGYGVRCTDAGYYGAGQCDFNVVSGEQFNVTGTGRAVFDGGTGTGTLATVEVYGGRNEAQFWVRATGSGSSVHAARFQQLTSGASIILATSGGNSAYLESGAVGPFTGSHDALVLKEDTFEAGDIIIDVEKVESQGVSDCIFTGIKSSTVNQSAIGIYVDKHTLEEQVPAPFKDFENAYTEITETEYQFPISDQEYETRTKTEEQHFVPNKDSLDQYMDTHDVAIVNSVGEGSINVCGENGDIAVGDLIVTSNTAGKGMKQDDDIIRSYTVAKAREAVTFASAGEVHQIACIYLCG